LVDEPVARRGAARARPADAARRAARREAGGDVARPAHVVSSARRQGARFHLVAPESRRVADDRVDHGAAARSRRPSAPRRDERPRAPHRPLALGSILGDSSAMGLLTFALNVTLDGCCDHRAGVVDDEVMRYWTRLMNAAGAMLFGRVTYEMMESAWPQV